MENGMVADIAAVTRPNFGYGMGCGMGGFGMGGWEGLIGLIVLAGIFNGGFGGFGGGNGALGLGAIYGSQQFNQLDNGIRAIQNGICDATFALNNSINQTNSNLANALCSTTYELAGKIDNNRFAAQQCCCETQRQIEGVKYANAQNTCDIVNAIHAEGTATRDLITQNKIEALQTKITELTAANQSKDLIISQEKQNRYLVNEINPKAVPAYVVQNPNCCQNPCGCGYYAD